MNVGLSLGSLAIEAVFGYAGAAFFTTINPAIGALFGITSSVITTIAKEIFAKSNMVTHSAGIVIANAIGILGGAGVVAVIAGTTLTPAIALGLFISILAAKIIFAVTAAICCGCLVKESAARYNLL